MRSEFINWKCIDAIEMWRQNDRKYHMPLIFYIITQITSSFYYLIYLSIATHEITQTRQSDCQYHKDFNRSQVPLLSQSPPSFRYFFFKPPQISNPSPHQEHAFSRTDNAKLMRNYNSTLKPYMTPKKELTIKFQYVLIFIPGRISDNNLFHKQQHPRRQHNIQPFLQGTRN